MIGMKLQSLFRRKEKLTNHLVINAEAGRSLPAAGIAHMAKLTAAATAKVGGWFAPKQKQLTENIWIVLFKYLVHPDIASRHPQLARQRLPVIDLIISNYPTALCTRSSPGLRR